MKRNLTFVLSVLALMACLIAPKGMNGQTTHTIGWGTASGNAGTYTNFTATSGSVSGVLSFSTAKNSSANAPAYNANSSELRLYYASNGSGGSITITPVSGVTITDAVMTTSTSPSVAYYVDGGSAVSVTATNNTYTISGISASTSLEIQNVNTSNTQLRIKTIAITYTSNGGQPTTYTVTYDGNGATSGTAPTDSNSPYNANATVTVLGNMGNLVKTGYTFDGWNTAADGSGTDYDENDSFQISANTTLYAQWTQTGGGTGGDEWVLTPLADLTSTDVFVIVGNNGSNCAMSNDNGTSNPPAAVPVTVSGNKLTGTIANNIQWNISGDATDGYTFYPNGSTTTWLYCTNTNNGVRVGGTNSNTTFEIDGGYLKHVGTSRYVGIYQSQDWRCYTSINSNIAGQTFAFYKKVTTTPSITIPASIALGNVLVGQQIQEAFTVSQANLTAGITLSASTGTLSTYSIAQGDPATQVTWTYTPATAGAISATITATSGTLSETLSITGTAVTQMTVAAALAATAPQNGVYVHGYISQIDEVEINQYHNATYWISDDGTTTGQMKVYHGKYLNNDPFTAIDQIGVGDEVVVTGNITEYQNANQLAAGNYIVSLTPHQAQSYDLTVSALSNVEMFVFDANDQTSSLIDGGATAQTVQVLEGTSILVSISAANGYYLASFIVDGVDHLADIDPSDDSYTFPMPSHNVTIAATAQPKVTVNYSVNGTVSQAQVVPGSITLPTSANLTNDVLFAGWTYAPYDIANIMPAGTTVTVQGGETFYAVYSVTTTTGGVSSAKDGASYVKVTEVPTDGWEGDYLIVYEDFAIEGFEELEVLDSHYGNTNANTYATYANLYQYYNDGVIEYNATTSSYAITVAETTNGYSLYDNDDEAYLGNSSSNTGAKLRWDTEFQSNRNEWTLGVNSIVSVYDDDYAIRWNNTAPRFAIYGTSGQSAIQLYKYTDGSSTPVTTTAYYTRVFMDETATAAMSITGPSYIPSGYYLDMDGNTLTNGMTADSLVIADGGQYMGNSVAATMQKVILPYSDQQGVNDKWYAISIPFTQSIAPGQNNYMVDMVTDVTGEYTYDFYRFDNNYPGAEWRNFRLNGGFSMTAGQGYLYAHKHGITLNFTGTLNATTANVTSAAFSNGNTYMANYFFAGNPFSCQATILNHSDFFVMNAAGTDFVLDSDGILEPLQGAILYDANAAANYTITYVSGTGDNESIVDDGELFKAIINLSVTKDRGEAIDVARVRFGEGLQIGKFQLDPNNTRIYFTQNGKEYAVVRSDAQGELPVGFHAGKNGTYTVNVETENVEMFYLHLVDNMTGADVDLLQTPSYTFEANSGDNANRFRLVFDANNVEENGASTSSATFAYFNGSEWVISNMGDATLQVIDIMGRVLSSETINDDAKVTIEQVPGVYMLRLVNGNDVKVQKVVVK